MGKYTYDPETGMMLPKWARPRTGKRLCSLAAAGIVGMMQRNDPLWGLVSLYMPGNDLLDYSSYKYTVSVNGTVTNSATQAIGGPKSIDFTGANTANWLSAPPAASPLQAQSMTIEAYTYRTATPSGSTNPEIVSCYSTTLGACAELYMGSTVGMAASRVSKTGSTTPAANPFAGAPSNNVWAHTCVVYDGTNIGVATGGVWGTPIALTGALSNSNTTVTTIGRQSDGVWPLQAYLAHLRITYSVLPLLAARYVIGTNFTPPVPPYPTW